MPTFGIYARNYFVQNGSYQPDMDKPKPDSAMTGKTFDEWKAKGYHVIKGQKASGRNAEGKATFNDRQVEKFVDRPRGNLNYPARRMSRGDYYENVDRQEDYDMFEAVYGYDRDWF